MATYNIADGTGGLDASIRFEQNRPEVSHEVHLGPFILYHLMRAVLECRRKLPE
jgi:hypothetical protein